METGKAERLPAEHHPGSKKLIEAGSDPELSLLWWLFRHKNVMPWEVYEQGPGYRDLAYAFASLESEARAKR